jgi:hypothetical protein
MCAFDICSAGSFLSFAPEKTSSLRTSPFGNKVLALPCHGLFHRTDADVRGSVLLLHRGQHRLFKCSAMRSAISLKVF